MRAIYLLIFYISIAYAFSPRIFGGESVSKAGYAEVNFQASLRYKGFHVCGAVKVAAKRVITSARCVYWYNVTDYTLVFDVSKDSTNYINVTSRKIHQLFNIDTFEHDIAILSFESDLTLNDLKPAIAAVDETIPHTLLGWGITGPNAPLALELRTLNVDIMPHELCVQQYKNLRPVKNTMICASKFSYGMCDGDQGGALYEGANLVGIASWRGGCNSMYPGVFTYIFEYQKWIEDNIV